MRFIILSSLACVAVPSFSTLSRKHPDLRGKKITEGKMCIFVFLQSLSEILVYLILRRIQRGTIVSVHRFLCKVPVILVRLEWNLNFIDGFSENIQV